MHLSTLKSRVDALLALQTEDSPIGMGNHLFNGALTVMSAVYGPESHQVKAIQDFAPEVRGRKTGHLSHNMYDLITALKGALQNLRAELDAGFVGSLQLTITGEVLTDFIRLAKEVLTERGDNAKNVSAVLTAAAYEDTIRRMGEDLAGITQRIDLSEVINILKVKGFLKGPQVGIALSYLKFRNDALHADWAQIDRTSVSSALGFIEELLLKHFQ